MVLGYAETYFFESSECSKSSACGRRSPVSFGGLEAQQVAGVLVPAARQPNIWGRWDPELPVGSSTLGLGFKRKLCCEETHEKGTWVSGRMI